MLSSRKDSTLPLKLYEEKILGYLILKNLQTEFKYTCIFSPFWHRWTPTGEKVYPTARHIYRKADYTYCAASTTISVEITTTKIWVHIYVLPVSNHCLSRTEWQFVALAKTMLFLMPEKIALWNKNMF